MENEIFKAFIDLVSMINRPDRDKKMIAEAGVNLEEAAFRVFVGIGHVQPTSVGDLAAMMGKNYSSVSRQIDKLEAAGLVHTYPSNSDSRIRVSELTKSGEELNTMISLTRERIMREAMADWTLEEKTNLLHNLRRLFESMKKFD
ncbi:MarR family winged helix-turn-helix transcriptional regulator [Paenibacillus sp. CN-4]|uniref:MarR family winged helix-turn-helix transcriptional regulator n=1 Tax=Paenibacillus nanchangensis TaxID=3348343 RepID=UPI00397BC04F